MHCGQGIVFTGCRSWHNSDDGWDLFETDYGVTITNCWQWHSGDGADFMTFFVAKTGSDAAPGTRAQPVLTIGQGLTLAKTQGKRDVYVATGVYSDSSTADITTQVTWQSSDPTVATVSNAAGTAGRCRGERSRYDTKTTSMSKNSGSIRDLHG